MPLCPRCDQPFPPHATRCPNCGSDIPATAPPTDDSSGLIPGFTEAPQTTGPSEQRRYWWSLGGLVVAALVLLALIAVLDLSGIGHRGPAHATPATTAVLTPTGGTSSTATAFSSTIASRSRSKSTPTTPADRQRGLAQASRIAGFLTHSAQTRASIHAALSAISDCTHIASAVSTLRNAAEVRTHILTALASTEVSALPHGTVAVADLRQAMRASANADRHYAAWGQTVAGCHGHAPHNAEYAAAYQSGTVADLAKQRFANEWNPIAVTYGLAKQNANTI